MKLSLNKIKVWLGAACLLGSMVCTHAFALLGPYEPWMQQTNGMRQPGYIFFLSDGFLLFPPEALGIIPAEDIGGPMDIGSGYRWNVPVITYGFDRSFLDYFGTNGVAAVVSAITIFNDLPPASSTVFSNYSLVTKNWNYAIEVQSETNALYDLKSQTLSLLLEQLGLSQPTRYVCVLKKWDLSLQAPDQYPYDASFEPWWGGWAIPEFVVQRNFDLQTLEASSYVNESFFAASILSNGNGNHIMVTYSGDRIPVFSPAVADFNQSPGEFYTGLTRDDVSGLCYLLSTNTITYEDLLPDVRGAGANANSFVNGAWRPGVDKVIFIPQPVDSLPGTFLVCTNQFTDRYFTNGVLAQQSVARVVAKPDILFCVADLDSRNTIPEVVCTGTTNWINNASLNGNPTGAGPGVIQPSITITFNQAGRMFEHDSSMADETVYENTSQWGTFDGSTNAPITYPVARTGTDQMTVRMWLTLGNSLPQQFEWSPAGPIGTPFDFQTSTNLTNWTTSFVVTNDGNICTYFNNGPLSQSRFYRLIPSTQ
jgi:hypothetical protein